MKSALSTVSAVIVNWNRARDTIECVESVLAQGLSEAQVILVDNGSSDGSDESIRQAFPEAVLLSLPENLGFARGYNVGIRHAMKQETPFIFLLNNDTKVEPVSLEALVASRWDVAVPKILYYQRPQHIWSAGARWTALPPRVKMIGFGKTDAPEYNEPGPLRYATACALMVKRAVFETVGGFDEMFGSYMEDYDFSYRVCASGFSMGYVPEARILHKVSLSLGEYSRVRWELQGRNTVLFYRKDGRFPWIVLASYLLWVTAREMIVVRPSALQGFWQGVCQGLRMVQHSKGIFHGKHDL